MAFQFAGTPERMLQYELVGPIRTGSTVFMTSRKTNLTDWAELDDLSPYIIGQVRGYAYQSDFDKADLRRDSSAQNPRQLVSMLLAGRIDVIVGDRAQLMYFVREQRAEQSVRILSQAPGGNAALCRLHQGRSLAVPTRSQQPLSVYDRLAPWTPSTNAGTDLPTSPRSHHAQPHRPPCLPPPCCSAPAAWAKPQPPPACKPNKRRSCNSRPSNSSNRSKRLTRRARSVCTTTIEDRQRRVAVTARAGSS